MAEKVEKILKEVNWESGWDTDRNQMLYVIAEMFYVLNKKKLEKIKIP